MCAQIQSNSTKPHDLRRSGGENKCYNWECTQIPEEVREQLPYSALGEDQKKQRNVERSDDLGRKDF